MEKMTKDRVLELADLVRLAISDEEAEKYTENINDTLSSVEILNEINTDDVEATTHGIVLENVMRKDEPERTVSPEDALNNAPDQEDGHFKVPSIMD